MEAKCRAITKENIRIFLDSFDTLLCDCDGVIWTGDNPIPNCIETLNKLQDIGKKVILVTNNSTKTRKEYLSKCQRLKLNVNQDHIYCTSYLAAAYLKQLNFQKKVYVVGSTGVSGELDEVGIRHFGVGPDPCGTYDSLSTWLTGGGVELDPEVGAVIVGFDNHVSYPKFTKAASYLNKPDCIFIATNTDERFPCGKDLIIPGSGTVVRAVETCAEREAIVVGKPSPSMYEIIQKDHNLTRDRTIMVGDRANTDILLGTRCGLHTLLVLSGVSSVEDIDRWKQSSNSEDKMFLADYCLPKLGDLLPLLG